MPPHLTLTNSFFRDSRGLLTPALALTLSLTAFAGASYGGQKFEGLHEELLPATVPTPLLGNEAVGDEDGVPVAPEAGPTSDFIAQASLGVPVQTGVTIPWPGTAPAMPVGQPAVPPQGMPAGGWTMVWMPYSMPIAWTGAGSPGQASPTMTVLLPAWVYMGMTQGAGVAPQPTGPNPVSGIGAYPQEAPQNLYPQVMPGAPYAQGVPQSPYPQYPSPLPYAQAIPPQGYVPGNDLPNDVPSNTFPYGYGASPYGNSSLAAVPPAMAGFEPYGQVSPPGSAPPLAVSQGPNDAGTAPLPPPPVAYQPAVPSVPLHSNLAPAESWETPPATPGLVIDPTTVVVNPSPAAPTAGAMPNRPITEPNLDLQGLYVLQGDDSSARARLSGEAFLTPNLLVGGALDLVTGPDLTNNDGVDLTELYLAASVPGAPGLRFRLGQLDLTSYFDRNSFAKDIGRDFFNDTFHTNPALISGANATASRPGGLVQWAVTDDITLNAAAFSSASDITDFALDGFATEVGVRTGNLIVRGTFLTARDTQFQGSGGRLDSYGVNAEWFIPEVNIGLFGRYGHLNNSGTGFSGDTYSFGLNALDVFMENDRLGLGYGRNLATTIAPGETPDVLELFYDFEVTPHIRLGFTFQQRDQFRESYAGFRVRGDLDLLPRQSAE